MFQRRMWKVYWKFVVLTALLVGLIVFARGPSARADDCMACDENYYSCHIACNGDPTCLSNCQGRNLSCSNFCTEAMTGYHSYEYSYNQEHQMCLQMGHRAGYRRCFNGNPLYPDEYNACIAGGSLVEDCCWDQESLYDNENCVP